MTPILPPPNGEGTPTIPQLNPVLPDFGEDASTSIRFTEPDQGETVRPGKRQQE